MGHQYTKLEIALKRIYVEFLMYRVFALLVFNLTTFRRHNTRSRTLV